MKIPKIEYDVYCKLTDTNLINMVKDSMENFINVYRELRPYDYIILKSVILRFLQGKNVKVSIFIQENLQDSNSIIYLPMNEKSPPFTKKLGKVENKLLSKDENFQLKLNHCYIENKNEDRMDNFTTDFGKNMFGKESLHFAGRIKIKKPENIKEEEKVKNKFNKVYDEAPIPISVNSLNIINNKEKEKKTENENNNKNKTNEEENKKSNEIKNSVFLDDYYENKELSEEQKKIISQGNKNDFNLFSSVFAENENNDDELFEFDLFGSEEKKNEKPNEEDFINIQNKNNNIKNKMNEKFGSLLKKEEDGDDLLDLMDKNI